MKNMKKIKKVMEERDFIISEEKDNYISFKNNRKVITITVEDWDVTIKYNNEFKEIKIPKWLLIIEKYLKKLTEIDKIEAIKLKKESEMLYTKWFVSFNVGICDDYEERTYSESTDTRVFYAPSSMSESEVWDWASDYGSEEISDYYVEYYGIEEITSDDFEEHYGKIKELVRVDGPYEELWANNCAVYISY